MKITNTKIEILVKLNECFPKIKILVKIQNFGQNSKFWSKFKILVKIQNFGQKSKIETGENPNIIENRNIAQK